MKSIIIMLMLGVFINSTSFAQKLTADKVPAAVQKTFKSKFPTVTDVTWGMEGKKEYEANFKMNKQEMSATFDKDGKWLETETEIENSSLPQAVSATIAKEFAGYKIKESAQLETPAKGKLYEVELTNGKETMEVQLKASGEVVNKKVEKKEKDEKD